MSVLAFWPAGKMFFLLSPISERHFGTGACMSLYDCARCIQIYHLEANIAILHLSLKSDVISVKNIFVYYIGREGRCLWIE